MVLNKRLDYGSTGYQVPPMPRVPRSARGKRSVRKKLEDKHISAFDLLATVAGELLSERENSPPPSKQSGSLNRVAIKDAIKQELHDNETPFKAEVFDQGSCNESTCASENLSKRQALYSLKEHQQTSKCIEKGAGELMLSGKRSESGRSLPPIARKSCTEGFSSALKKLCDYKAEVGVKSPVNRNVADGNVLEILEDPMDLDAKPPALVSSDSSVEVPISCGGSFPRCREPRVDRDDDENSSGCTHPNSNFTKAFRPQRIGDRRIRKLLASKFWKAPTSVKDGELLNTDGEMKPVFRSRKLCYTRQRTQRSSFKRRKLFERSSISASNGGIYGEAMSSSPKFGGIKIEASDAHPSATAVNGASSSSSGQKSSYESGDYHVKLSIKSFKVPELFIEIPESATVGSLKRTVMEAVTAILAGGLRVGVLLQGKKVRDDKQTLIQAGISGSDRMDNLGFTLEPNSAAQTTPSLTCTEDPASLFPSNLVLPCPSTEPIQRSLPAAPAIERAPLEAELEPAQAMNLTGPESDRDSVRSSSAEKTAAAADSKAIIPVQSANSDALAVVPLRKSRRSELVQRRIRRPFSVAEVEALVQAVEKLGTGRWRDVKIRAFDNAKHRTYVDLKDKWKTLVHTARISPQQRRGEPVPQELLDRVLSAHAYWSQQQAKLQVNKPPQSETACLLI